MADKSTTASDTVDDVVADVLANPDRYRNRFANNAPVPEREMLELTVRGSVSSAELPVYSSVPESVALSSEAVAAAAAAPAAPPSNPIPVKP